MFRADGRRPEEIRDIHIVKSFLYHAHGSVLIEWGKTRALCTAMYSADVPSFLEGKGSGWLTAEYAMLPASTPQRKPRETKSPDGRSTEISRLIGRSLRSIIDLRALQGYTVHIDCDVIDADGGTRTACITGAYVALVLCIESMLEKKLIGQSPIEDGLAAVSCGIVDDMPLCDLCYEEDCRAAADMNVVMSHGGGLVEMQCTGEKRPLLRSEFDTLIRYAEEALGTIRKIQREALG